MARFEMRVPDELMARLDAARGHEPRASFVKRALETALQPKLVPSGGDAIRVDGPDPTWMVGEVRFERVQAEVDERESSGCPECSGELAGGVCRDCGFRL